MYKGISVKTQKVVEGDHTIINGYDYIITEDGQEVIIYSESLKWEKTKLLPERVGLGCITSIIFLILNIVILILCIVTK